jgi:hypothetical protein
MAGDTTTASPIDPIAESYNLANIFYALSQAVDNFRFATRNPPLTGFQAQQLKLRSQDLDNQAHLFTAEAIGATLQAIQADLANIKTLTAQAQQQVQNLNAVDKVVKIVTSVLSLGTAIAAGNVASVLASAQALAGLV